MRIEVIQPDFCDVSARPLPGGVVMVGSTRCCSIECAMSTIPIVRTLVVLHGHPTERRESHESNHASAYHTRWR